MAKAGLKPLNSNMLRCIELMVYTDMLKGQIAEELGVRPETVTAWQKREDFQDALRNEMQRGFSTLAAKARNRLDKLIDSPNQAVALGACKEVLNKAGYQETQKIEQTIDTNIVLEITD